MQQQVGNKHEIVIDYDNTYKYYKLYRIVFYNTVIRLNKIFTVNQYSIIIIILYMRPL